MEVARDGNEDKRPTKKPRSNVCDESRGVAVGAFVVLRQDAELARSCIANEGWMKVRIPVLCHQASVFNLTTACSFCVLSQAGKVTSYKHNDQRPRLALHVTAAVLLAMMSTYHITSSLNHVLPL